MICGAAAKNIPPIKLIKNKKKKMNTNDLINKAINARENAYAPYSKFMVGAAVLTQKGNVFTGCNVENASYGGTICAERVAMCKAVSSGERKIKAITIVYDENNFASPCGICRQFIYEFGADIEIIMAKLNGEYKIKKISELLPDGFGGGLIN